MKPPTFTDKTPSARDLIQRMRNYNVQMTDLAKKGVGEMHTGNIEGLLENFSMLMAGEYGDQEAVEIPVDVIREISLFASVTLSRLLWERYKLEKTLGRPVIEAPKEEPSAEDLTEAISSGILGHEDE